MSAPTSGTSPRRTPWILTTVALLATIVAVVALVLGLQPGAQVQDLVLAQGDDESDDVDNAEVQAAQVSPDVTFDVFLSRDPFEPVVPEPPEPVAPAPTDPTDPTVPTDPSTPTQPGDPSAPDPSAPGKEAQPEVIETSTTAQGDGIAVIRVATTTYEVVVGEVFSGYRLVTVDGDCATWLRGDTLQTGCVGDTQK